LTAVDYMVK
nr:low density lipoprotein receptor-related protein [chickens, Peptide Partial, 9 aa] [Gallus gallus]